MKYIISENKLEGIIKDTINKYYDLDDINWTYMEDDDGNEIEAAEFYIGDYDEDTTIFRWYGKSYWTDEGDFRKDLSPMLMIEDDGFIQEMQNLFNDRWVPVLKDWFNENFPYTKVKNIDYYY